MIKQIYRFLSVVLISNILFSSAVLSKPQKNTDKSDKTVKEQKSDNNQKLDENNPDLEKMPPYKSNSGRYTTIYGVMNITDFFNSYSTDKKNSDNKQ